MRSPKSHSAWREEKVSEEMAVEARRRVGIVGFGHVGEYLVQKIREEGESLGLELAFVWNRTMKKMEGIIEPQIQLHRLEEYETRKADVIVEVAHPDITREFGELFLSAAHLMNLRQGRRPVEEYAAEFYAWAADVGWNDAALRYQFRLGLSEVLKDELARDPPASSLRDLIMAATQLDRRLRKRRAERN
ncbi:aspartate dehydrogenase domain-containing protein [Mantella aurantiaca]